MPGHDHSVEMQNLRFEHSELSAEGRNTSTR
jgi:hypothetical protein